MSQFKNNNSAHVAGLIDHTSKQFYDLVVNFLDSVDDMVDFQYYQRNFSGNVAFSSEEVRDDFIVKYNKSVTEKSETPDAVNEKLFATVYSEEKPERVNRGNNRSRSPKKYSKREYSPKKYSKREKSPKKYSKREYSPKKYSKREHSPNRASENSTKVKIYYTLKTSDHEGSCSTNQCEYSIQGKSHIAFLDNDVIANFSDADYTRFVPRPLLNNDFGCSVSKECKKHDLAQHSFRVNVSRVEKL